jgi:hypothetical protein
MVIGTSAAAVAKLLGEKFGNLFGAAMTKPAMERLEEEIVSQLSLAAFGCNARFPLLPLLQRLKQIALQTTQSSRHHRILDLCAHGCTFNGLESSRGSNALPRMKKPRDRC